VWPTSAQLSSGQPPFNVSYGTLIKLPASGVRLGLEGLMVGKRFRRRPGTC
jgi:hypothetical protein